jgi:hypothetical protein
MSNSAFGTPDFISTSFDVEDVTMNDGFTLGVEVIMCVTCRYCGAVVDDRWKAKHRARCAPA